MVKPRLDNDGGEVQGNRVAKPLLGGNADWVPGMFPRVGSEDG